MLVKIIKGTYGHRPDPGAARVVRKDRKSPAFELDDKEAKRIISLGVAQAYNHVTKEDCEYKTEETSGGLDDDSSKLTAEAIESMEFNDLRKVAKAYGLDTKGTKEDLIIRLKASLFPANGEDNEPDDDEDDESDDGGEMLPEFDAKEPVI